MKKLLFYAIPFMLATLLLMACEPEENIKWPEPKNALEGYRWVHEIKDVIDGVTHTTTTHLVFTDGKNMKKTVYNKSSWLGFSEKWTDEDVDFTYRYDGEVGIIYHNGKYYCDLAYDGETASPLMIIKQKPAFPAYDTILYERKKL